MNPDDTDTMRDEYDFSKGVRGKHHKAYREGTNVVLLEPEAAHRSRDINEEGLLALAKNELRWESGVP